MRNPMREQSVGLSVLVLVLFFAALFLIPRFFPGMNTPADQPLEVSEQSYTEETNEYQIEGSYPVFSGGSESARNFANETVQNRIDSALAGFKESSSSFEREPELPKSSFTIEYDVEKGPASIHTIAFQFSQFISGAAHPYSFISPTSINLENGTVVSFEDVIRTDDASLLSLSEIVGAKVRNRFSAEEEAMLYIFWEGLSPSVENYESFIPGEEGIVFVFNPYHIAAYAAGIIQIDVAYSELENVLTEEFKILLQ